MAFKCKIQIYLLVVDPGRPQSLLKLGQTHDVDVYKLYHFIALGWAAGFVSHNLSHDPVEKRKTTTLIQQIDPHVKLVSRQPLHLILLGRPQSQTRIQQRKESVKLRIKDCDLVWKFCLIIIIIIIEKDKQLRLVRLLTVHKVSYYRNFK